MTRNRTLKTAFGNPAGATRFKAIMGRELRRSIRRKCGKYTRNNIARGATDCVQERGKQKNNG